MSTPLSDLIPREWIESQVRPAAEWLTVNSPYIKFFETRAEAEAFLAAMTNPRTSFPVNALEVE